MQWDVDSIFTPLIHNSTDAPLSTVIVLAVAGGGSGSAPGSSATPLVRFCRMMAKASPLLISFPFWVNTVVSPS